MQKMVGLSFILCAALALLFPVARTGAALDVGDSAVDFNLLSQFDTFYRLFDYTGDVIIVNFSTMT